MTGRPLSSRPRKVGSSWVASVPVARRASKRMTRRFPTEESAQKWLDAAHKALSAGGVPPDAEPYRLAALRPKRAAVSSEFSEVAWAWFADRYERQQRAGVERRDDVKAQLRNHIIPYFSDRVADVDDLEREDVLEWLDYLSGYRPPGTQSGRAAILPVKDFSLQEIVTISGRSIATVRRAYKDGKFPNAVRKELKGRQVICVPAGDVLAAGFGSATSTDAPFGYSKSMASSLLNVLRMILEFARAKRLMTHDPTEGLRAKKPLEGTRSNRRPNTEKAKAFDQSQSKEIASLLTIHFQLVFWLQRLMGLRVGEAFGVELADLQVVDGWTLLTVQNQGGKSFKVSDGQGNPTLVGSKKILKTDASYRIIPMPKCLAQFVDVYVEAFHGSDAFGEPVRLAASVPGVNQAGYRRQLKAAMSACGLGQEDTGAFAGSHHLRISNASELGWSGKVSEIARSKFLGHKLKGHEGGADVTSVVYTLDMPRIRELLELAEVMDESVTKQISSIVSPTSVAQLFPGRAARRNEADTHAIEVLDANGFIAPTEADGAELLTMVEASEMLGLSYSQTSNLVRKGVLVAKPLRRSHGMPTRGVTLASVTQRLALEFQASSREAIQAELNLTAGELNRLITQLGITPKTYPGVQGHRFDDEMVDQMRAQVALTRSLVGRAVPVADAAAALEVIKNTVRQFVKAGHLKVDEDATLQAGVMMIDRASLESLLDSRASRTRPRKTPPAGTVPLEEAMEMLGLGRIETLALRRQGLVIHRTTDYRFHVEMESLKALAAKRSVG